MSKGWTGIGVWEYLLCKYRGPQNVDKIINVAASVFNC